MAGNRRTKVLFLAWGFSIHAFRRIQLFVDDPEFEVAVVSTHDYNFTNARNILLTDAKGEKLSIWRKLFDKVKTVLNNNPLLLLLEDIGKGIKDFRIIKSAVTEFNPDIIFLQTLLYPCYLAYFLHSSLPIVITFWNGDVVWWAKWNGVERWFKKQIVTYGIRRARSMTVNSHMAFNACLSYGTQADKIHLIRYPGIDLERFKPLAKDEARKKLGITSKKVVLCPRGLGGFLNSDVIVESAVNVVKKYPDILFLFISGVGGDVELEKHQQRTHNLNIEKHFRWDGQVPWDIIPIYYNASDVMVSVSSNDSLPNCMLEAMACGIPVVMGDIPQIREWVNDDVNGFLVPPRDQLALSDRILKVLDNADEHMKSFVEKNLELVKHEVDSKRNVKQVKELVRVIAGKTV